MDQLQSVYELTKKFPFSITGYPDIETEISNFFADFSKHHLNHQNDHPAFIVGIFGQLAGLGDRNGEAIDKIYAWETERIKKFLFSNYEGDRAEVPMSLYVHILQTLSNSYAINILTNNFRSDINFRISLTNDTKPEMRFRENAFEVNVPRSIFRPEIIKPASGARRNLGEKLHERLGASNWKNLIVKQLPGNVHELEITEKRQGREDHYSIYQELCEEIFSIGFDQFYQLCKPALAEMDIPSAKEIIFKNENVQLEELLKIAYAGSFLCMYYGVSLEYILSSCRVHEGKYYGLGGLAIGIKQNSKLLKTHKTFYKTIADHISRNISVQITNDLFSVENYRQKAPQYLAEFCNTQSPISRLTHDSSYGLNGSLQYLKSEANYGLGLLRTKKIISDETSKVAKSLIESISEEGITSDQKREVDHLFRYKLKDFIKEMKLRFKDTDFAEPDESVNGTKPYNFDFFWLIDILKRIAHNNYKTHVDLNTGKPRIEIDIVDQNGEKCSNEGRTDYNLRIRFIDKGAGMDLPESILNSTTSYSLLHRGQNYYEVLQTHGNIYVHSKGKKISILDIDRNPVEPSPIQVGTVFEILLKAK